ncbi:disintegrin and metalloproteinase domain-containing protein 10-like isoform X2 [Leptidea sinapis]|uniref:disintegrin and metalloproteinase domain-containing protein 10-like isoform X2 n=1 Tax=Leptidea sinapis TaxID=189913 RepID=UPI0021C32A5A|nr:disintegrin and metalloproteinase domain-containing protein 10-like isoform X2 [Leptidea sinapis]
MKKKHSTHNGIVKLPFLANRTLHADPYGIDDVKKVFGLFDNDDIQAPSTPPRQWAPFSFPHFSYNYEYSPFTPGIPTSRICDLLLLADKEFYDKEGNSSPNQVVRRMMHAVAHADIIFRNADFDKHNVPANIGFSVKYILVLTSNETNTRVFGDLGRENSVDGRSYLMKFSRLRRLSEVCLGVAFSGHAFHNRTLGLSFTSLDKMGGVCDGRANGHSYNTLALAHATAEGNERVPERVAALTLAHEIGHSFGAHHDDGSPNPECRGFLMGSQSSTSESTKHFEFSTCSKRLIAETLKSMRSSCLAEVDEAFCGNGLKEKGEACDCGLPSNCNKDSCCTPRAGGALVFEEGALYKEGCRVAPAASCHPSQGLCCTANCQLANLTASGINCQNQDSECTCEEGSCSCGLGGRCLKDKRCHAAECVKLGLEECFCRYGPGGVLGAQRMCGPCCTVRDARTMTCVGAEFAAHVALSTNSLPDDWPYDDYRGPNVTLKLCNTKKCVKKTIRAWPSGGVCVLHNRVGMCDRGICRSVQMLPYFHLPSISMNPYSSLRSGATEIKMHWIYFMAILIAMKQI